MTFGKSRVFRLFQVVPRFRTLSYSAYASHFLAWKTDVTRPDRSVFQYVTTDTARLTLTFQGPFTTLSAAAPQLICISTETTHIWHLGTSQHTHVPKTFTSVSKRSLVHWTTVRPVIGPTGGTRNRTLQARRVLPKSGKLKHGRVGKLAQRWPRSWHESYTHRWIQPVCLSLIVYPTYFLDV